MLHTCCAVCTFAGLATAAWNQQHHRTAFFMPDQPAREPVALNLRAQGMPVQATQAMLTTTAGKQEFIKSIDARFYPLCFPLLFPRGAIQGWHPGIRVADANGKVSKLTRLRWARQVAMTSKIAHASGLLYNEFLLSVQSNIEDDTLSYLAANQNVIARRSAGTAPVNDGDPSPIVIPPSFRDSFSQKRKLFREAMGIVRRRGKQSYFVTMTTNANWPEIQQQLLPGQTFSDRPDIVARVFMLKLQKMLKELPAIFNGGQPLLYCITVIEFQRR
jgi:hypothetical protein